MVRVMEKSMTSRRLTQLSAVALGVLLLWALVSQPGADLEPDIFMPAIGILGLLIAILFGLVFLAMSFAIRGSRTYWSGGVDSKQVGRIIVMIGLIVLTQLAVGLSLYRLGDFTTLYLVMNSLLAFALIPAGLLVSGFVKWPERKSSASKLQRLLTGIVGISVAAAVSFAAVSWAPEPVKIPPVSELSMILAVILAAAAAEEVVFRVLLLTALVDHTRSRLNALVLSAVVFGLAHAPLELFHPAVLADWALVSQVAIAYAPQFIAQIALGLVLGALWLRTGSITVVVLVHAVNNVGSTLAYGL